MSTSNQRPRPQPTPLCASYAPLLPLLRSGELTAEQARDMQAHLATCAWCQRQLAAYDSVDAALRRQYGDPDATFPMSAATSAHPANAANLPHPLQRTASARFLSMEDIMREADSHQPVSPRATTTAIATDAPRRPPPYRPPTGLLATAAALLIVALLAGLFAWRGSLGALVGGRPHVTVTTVTTPTGAPTATPRPLVLRALVAGSYGGDVSSVSPHGARNWHTFIGGEVTALADDSSLNMVYAGIWFGKSFGAVYALDGATGHVLWHKAGIVPMTMQAVNGTLYVGTSSLYPKTTPVFFEALRGSNGATLWSSTAGGCDGSQFTVTQGIVIVDTGCNQVIALDSAAGSELWIARVTTQGAPVVVGGIAYIGYVALSIGDGKLLWNASAVNPNLPMTDAVGNNQVYIASPPLLYAVSPDTGAPLWNNAISGILPSAPAAGPGGVFVTTGSALEALSATGGSAVWTALVNTTTMHAPLVIGTVVYVSSSDGALYAFSAADGHKLWRVSMAGRVEAPAVGLYVDA